MLVVGDLPKREGAWLIQEEVSRLRRRYVAKVDTSWIMENLDAKPRGLDLIFYRQYGGLSKGFMQVD